MMGFDETLLAELWRQPSLSEVRRHPKSRGRAWHILRELIRDCNVDIETPFPPGTGIEILGEGPTKDSVREAFDLLMEFPVLAKRKFEFRDGVHRAPICFFLCTTHGEEFVVPIYNLFPDVLVFDEDKTEEFDSPFMIACLHSSKTVIKFFAEMDPYACSNLMQHTCRADPAHGNVECAIECLLRHKSLNDSEKLDVLKKFFSLMPDPFCACVQPILARAVAFKNGAGVLGYLADVLNEDLLSLESDDVPPVMIDADMADRLGVVIPKVKIRVNLATSWDPRLQGLIRLLPILREAKHLPKKLSITLPSFLFRHRVAKREFKQFMEVVSTRLGCLDLTTRQNDVFSGDTLLELLRYTTFDRTGKMSFILRGLTFIDPEGLSEFLSGENAPSNVFFVSPRLDFSRWERVEVSPFQSLQEINVCGVSCDSKEVLVGFLEQLSRSPRLETLKLGGDILPNAWNLDDEILTVVQNGNLRRLILRGGFQVCKVEFLGEIGRGCGRSLVECKIQMSNHLSLPNKKLEDMAELVESSNYTLEVFELYSDDLMSYQKYGCNKHYQKMQYVLKLNSRGRGTVGDPLCTPHQLVSFLCPALSLLSDSNEFSVAYSLLRERPELWC